MVCFTEFIDRVGKRNWVQGDLCSDFELFSPWVVRINIKLNAIFPQIRGIGELLEGLIPYSQRHFSRIDRLVRSTYLLDYTLMGMSVIDPEAPPTSREDRNKDAPPAVNSDMNGTNGTPIAAEKLDEDNVGELEEKASHSKKRRRPGKSKDRVSAKKAKDRAAGGGAAAAISIQA